MVLIEENESREAKPYTHYQSLQETENEGMDGERLLQNELREQRVTVMEKKKKEK